MKKPPSPKATRMHLRDLQTTLNSKIVGTNLGTNTFDNSAHGLRVVSSVSLRCDVRVEKIGLRYIDGSISGPDPSNPHDETVTFSLHQGEHIVGILLWAGVEIYAAQFITSNNRTSPVYGLAGGIVEHFGMPTLLWENNAILGAFNGTSHRNEFVRQLWVLLRRFWIDSRPVALTSVPRLFPGSYNGSHFGQIFNEYEDIREQASGRVSGVETYSMEVLIGIQFTYSYNRGNMRVPNKAPLRGRSFPNARQVFTMERDEYIVKVSGAVVEGSIQQIEFVTNKGKSTGRIGATHLDSSFEDTPRDVILEGKSLGLKFVVGKFT
ncbi:hypothetical protein RSOLAG22IIIB_12340 [Rhizoctonia solani]|uniref:Jacalin-type lectin domain-containing protein n=1 Tax=Rhizoctonia solani TaxID=456999 RepID=A0A0K6GDI3_9AGAM|nr:hypothetical protein RSOLAG22IIIB_12340 [Rhizoctonia solani]